MFVRASQVGVRHVVRRAWRARLPRQSVHASIRALSVSSGGDKGRGPFDDDDGDEKVREWGAPGRSLSSRDKDADDGDKPIVERRADDRSEDVDDWSHFVGGATGARNEDSDVVNDRRTDRGGSGARRKGRERPQKKGDDDGDERVLDWGSSRHRLSSEEEEGHDDVAGAEAARVEKKAEGVGSRGRRRKGGATRQKEERSGESGEDDERVSDWGSARRLSAQHDEETGEEDGGSEGAGVGEGVSLADGSRAGVSQKVDDGEKRGRGGRGRKARGRRAGAEEERGDRVRDWGAVDRDDDEQDGDVREAFPKDPFNFRELRYLARDADKMPFEHRDLTKKTAFGSTPTAKPRPRPQIEYRFPGFEPLKPDKDERSEEEYMKEHVYPAEEYSKSERLAQLAGDPLEDKFYRNVEVREVGDFSISGKCRGHKQRTNTRPLRCNKVDLEEFNWNNVPLLFKFLTPGGMIKHRKYTGMCAKCQRKVSKTIRAARCMGVIPHTIGFDIYKRLDLPNNPTGVTAAPPPTEGPILTKKPKPEDLSVEERMKRSTSLLY